MAEKISIVIPTLNEEENVETLVKRLDSALGRQNLEYELVFIDDNSDDKTYEILDELKSDYPIKVERKKGSRGKASSLIQGFGLASHELLVMIDADLQYPPEAITQMLEKIRLGADIVVAERKEKQTSPIRKFLSRGFSFFFGKMLHGLDCDVQSGLKLFRKQILREITLNPTPWTLDLELLSGARNAGYKIDTVEIVFAERTAGESKVDFRRQVFEIGGHALKYRFKQQLPGIIAPESEDSMIGAGFGHNRQRFVTHTVLSHEVSALTTFVPWQKWFIFSVILIVVLGFVLFPLKTMIILLGVLSFIYFLDVFFNLYLVSKSLSAPPEITYDDAQLASLDPASLPIYSILCPLFREAHILPDFVDAIEKLDWPKDKLDVILLFEETDKDTIIAARNLNLPAHFRIGIVPQSVPQTKPKACNYGLNLARGEYLVVYDAEDLPEPMQLRKAYLSFRQVGPQIICLQAKLNYYNPDHNLLTRLFTAEYSLWFDVILPGLQSINSYIPLGGTSNHFRTKDLQALQGWDPFNVTEDCDLGARLFKAGFRTAIIDSTTLEEANSNLKNWIRQRSRWIKGYMQTYLVHMRHPVEFFKDQGMDAAIFQLVVGGKIAFLFINPLLWLLTITYFAFRATLGPTIETFFPPLVFYIAVTSLIVGNFLCLYYYMLGCAQRKHWDLIKYVYMIPVYWLMTSIAAVMALYQLIVKPHFWEKTNHGLDKLGVENNSGINSKIWTTGAVLFIATGFANFLNFLFTAFLGRKLSYEQFGLIVFYNTILSFISISFGALSTTLNHRIAYINERFDQKAGTYFARFVRNRALIVAGVLMLVWVGLAQLLVRWFNLPGIASVLFFSPIFLFGLITAVNRGYLQGNLLYIAVSVSLVTESIVKLIAAAGLVYLHLEKYIYLSIPISLLVSFALTALLVMRKTRSHIGENQLGFPKRFYSAALLNGLSAAAFLTVDVILAKHYLTPLQAGRYSLISLTGNMVYFAGTLLNVFMITFVSQDLAKRVDPIKTFYRFFAGAFVLSATAFLAVGIFGKFTTTILFGSKALEILPYLREYTFASGIFTLTSTLISYHLARKNYSFSFAGLSIPIILSLGIVLHHESISAMVGVYFYSSLLGSFLVLTAHLFSSSKLPVMENSNDHRKRILIMNWRDNKHAYAGGAEVYIYELAKNWTQLGNKVTIFCGNDRQSERHEIIDGIEIVRRGGFYTVYLWAFIYYFSRFRRNCDVIIDCQNGVPFFTPLYAKEPVFCLMHHVHQEVFTHSLATPLAAFARFLEKDLMPRVYKNIKFITISQSSKTAIQEIGLGQAGIDIVHPGVNLNISAAVKKSTVPTIVYLGRLKAYKSIDVLIKAFAIVVKQEPKAKLIIAGSGEEESNLRRLTNELHLKSKIEFVGKVSEEKKSALLHRAWVFVNPSFMEGWGITTVEANACGTPIVAADVPGLRDSVLNPHTGFLVRHGDYPAFAEKILEIILNKELRESMGRQAKIWASNFDWRRGSERFLSIIGIENNKPVPVYETTET